MNKAVMFTMVVTLGIGFRGLANSSKPNPDPEAAMLQAFQNTRRYQLTTSSYSLSSYNDVISNVFVKFLSTYPDSPFRPDLESTLKAWVSERDEVAKGSIKHNNQWYQGDAAKTMLATIQTSQLITEGDRQLQAGKYDLAIGQFQKALQQRPITQETIGLIETKCEYAFSKWTASVSSMPSDPAAEIAAHNQRITQLRQQIEESNQQIAEKENKLSQRASAKWITRKESPSSFPCRVCGAHQGHWVVGGRCLGSEGMIVGDAKSITYKQDLLVLRNNVTKAQNEIAKEEAAIAALQSGGNQKISPLENIQNLHTQLAKEIDDVRVNVLGLPSKTQTSKVEVASVTTNFEVTSQIMVTQSVQQVAAVAPESTQPTESQSATNQVRASVQEAQQPAKQSWWNKYWYLVLIGLIVVYFFVRRLE
jgi:hypothetical protein